MYLDDTIRVGKVPEILQVIMDEVDGYYQKGDDVMYAVRSDDMEAITKQCCLEGLISEKQLDAIFRKYGWR